MFNVGDIWQHHGYNAPSHYLLLQNLGTPPHWYVINLEKGKYEKIFITRTDAGRFDWRKVA